MAKLSNQAYSPDDVQQILHLAIARQTQDQEDLTRSQLLEIGEELGISSTDLQAAESEWLKQRGELVHRQAFDRDRHQHFQQRSIKFIIINSFLVALNLLISGGLTWSLYVLVFGGLALAIRARKTYWLSGNEYRQQFESWQRKRVLKQSFDSVVSRLLPS
ncbi:MAG: 2TM domain-containing protein [Synechococcales cyanobacterium CRU_2_2]|nr:2TM domain-containing protein [Synechococcales cyanobacterium CRU_2_2]